MNTRVLNATHSIAGRQLQRTTPFLIQRDLKWRDALLAQFELACADVCSIIVSEDVVTSAAAEYLATLYHEMAQADEFQTDVVCLRSIPDTEAGRDFSEQFIGQCLPPFPFRLVAMRKKARIMMHWAIRIGATVTTTARPEH